MQKNNKLYDITKVYELASGDYMFIRKLLNVFVTETPGTIDSMFDVYKKEDTKTLKALAHRLKPSIKYLNIHSIVSDLNDIELGKAEYDTEQKLKKISTTLNDVILGLKIDIEAIPAA